MRYKDTLPIFVLGLFFLGHNFSATLSSAIVSSEQKQEATEKDDQLQELTPGQLLQSAISGSQTHVYQLQIPSHRYFHLTVTPQSVDLQIQVVDPNGLELVQCSSRGYGSTPVSAIIETDGLYRITVRLSKTTTAPGRYAIQADPLSTPTTNDHQRLAAERALNAGDTLLANGSADSLNQAVRKYEEAATAFHSTGPQIEEATAIKNIGQAYFLLGEYEAAIRYFRKALQFRGNISGTQVEGEILNHLGYALAGNGDNDEGLKYCTAALRLFQRLRVPRGEAQALTNLGEVHYAFSNLDQSLECYEKALPLWEHLGDLRGQGQTLMNFGITQSLLRDPIKSNDYLQKALTAWRQINDRRSEALTLTVLGTNYTRTGEWQKANDVFYQALESFQASGDRFGLARAYNCLAFLNSETGQQQAALDLYKQSLPLWVAIGRRTAEAGTRRLLGQIYLDRGETDQAHGFLTKALQLARELKDPLMQGYVLMSLGRANEMRLRTSEALSNYNEALNLFKQGGDRLREGVILNSIGYIYANLGQTRRALNHFNQSLRLARAVNKPTEVSSTLYNLARVEFKNGNSSQARARIEEALRISEMQRTKASSQELRSSYFATVHKQYEFYVDLLIQLSKSQPADSLEGLALEVSERARARSLLDSLNEAQANIQAEVDPGLLDQEISLRNKLNEKAAQQMQLSKGESAPEAVTLKKEMNELTAEYERVLVQIKHSNPRYAALTQPKPLTVREIQQQILDDNSLLLEYMLGDERSFVWVVGRSEISTFELPPRAQIDEAARELHKLLTVNQPVPGDSFEQRQARVNDANIKLPKTLASFSQIVLAPVAHKLGSKRLIIVPDESLQYIPFQALTIPAATKNSLEVGSASAETSEQLPLIFCHEIVYEPSASALALVLADPLQRNLAPNGLAVFANPVFEKDDPRVTSSVQSLSVDSESAAKVKEAFRDIGFAEGKIPALPASREEADSIMATTPWGTGLKALGFDANRANINKPGLAQYRIVHFATHGFVDYEHPELSGLVLSLVDQNGNPQDGFLRMHDVYNLKLSANLVVLSACNTGLGKDVKGEGLIGLTRGFMYAGAGSVVASLWKVDDEATAELMKRFYEGMFHRGLTPAAALREAQIWMWHQKRWRSPYYWAAFVIQGQYDQNVSVGLASSRTEWSVITLGILGIVLLASAFFLVVRRRRRIL